ncbi:16875_t:CDS:10, partial [Funneliformis mosseae]
EKNHYSESIPSDVFSQENLSRKFMKKELEWQNNHKQIKKNKNIADLPDDQTYSKKPLIESHQNYNSTFNLFTKFNCEEDVDIESEYYDTRKRHKIFYSWKDVIDKWIVESYNLSNEFQNFQQLTIRQVKETFNLKQNFRRQLPLSLPPVVNNMALEYSSMLNSFTLLSDIQDVSCANFSKVAELNDQVIINVTLNRTFSCYSLLLSSKSVNSNNEDTFVLETLYDLFKENFHDSMFKLIWANSESSISKNHRSSSSTKLKDSSSILINKDFVKLFNFQANALDELVKRYGNRIGLVSFGIWICGACICIYKMDINYDRIYKMFLTVNVFTPMEQGAIFKFVQISKPLNTL